MDEGGCCLEYNAMKEKIKSLEAELSLARAGAVQWVTYDGSLATLPGIGETVLFDGYDEVMVVFYRSTSAGRTWNRYRAAKPRRALGSELGQGDFGVEIGDRWAHLPTPPKDDAHG